MTRGFEDDLCALCGIRKSTRTGEHVWPHWYMKDLDRRGRPSSGWSINGKLVRMNNGNAIPTDQRQRVTIPACAQCNGELDRRFERPAKEPIRRLSSADWSGEASVEEWQSIGLWFAKILLLLARTESRWDHPNINQSAPRYLGAPPEVSWLINGEPPPSNLSLWAFNSSQSRGRPKYRLAVPSEIKNPDGSSTAFHIIQRSELGIGLTLLWHPGWTVLHPLVEEGSAWELLHSPPADASLEDLPRLSHSVVQWIAFEGTLAPGYCLDGSLPPLRASDNFLGVAPEVVEVFSYFAPAAPPLEDGPGDRSPFP